MGIRNGNHIRITRTGTKVMTAPVHVYPNLKFDSLDKLKPELFRHPGTDISIRNKDWERIWFAALELERTNRKSEYPLDEMQLKVPNQKEKVQNWLGFNLDEPDEKDIVNVCFGTFFNDGTDSSTNALTLNVELSLKKPGVLHCSTPNGILHTSIPFKLEQMKNFISQLVLTPEEVKVASIIGE